ncbi:MAG TPA: hypothetical protein DDX47_01940 [Candidatus Jacksonbacteria bacterium]|nr:MAG: hypothetical protein A2240_03205 [Candidatus Jacksonbacteria bacterium RIFOXYA2_FULL_43_12]OGY80259.1 MAG: hypothetical protein A2550_03975 [Candidatus Jacksonbacteria bacterium RIFOXYD2_FULL_43_21]HBH46108.1 hypothetical protein [Candidatus Jacksonbacteria bacterium]
MPGEVLNQIDSTVVFNPAKEPDVLNLKAETLPPEKMDALIKELTETLENPNLDLSIEESTEVNKTLQIYLALRQERAELADKSNESREEKNKLTGTAGALQQELADVTKSVEELKSNPGLQPVEVMQKDLASLDYIELDPAKVLKGLQPADIQKLNEFYVTGEPGQAEKLLLEKLDELKLELPPNLQDAYEKQKNAVVERVRETIQAKLDREILEEMSKTDVGKFVKSWLINMSVAVGVGAGVGALAAAIIGTGGLAAVVAAGISGGTLAGGRIGFNALREKFGKKKQERLAEAQTKASEKVRGRYEEAITAAKENKDNSDAKPEIALIRNERDLAALLIYATREISGEHILEAWKLKTPEFARGSGTEAPINPIEEQPTEPLPADVLAALPGLEPALYAKVRESLEVKYGDAMKVEQLNKAALLESKVLMQNLRTGIEGKELLAMMRQNKPGYVEKLEQFMSLRGGQINKGQDERVQIAAITGIGIGTSVAISATSHIFKGAGIAVAAASGYVLGMAKDSDKGFWKDQQRISLEVAGILDTQEPLLAQPPDVTDQGETQLAGLVNIADSMEARLQAGLLDIDAIVKARAENFVHTVRTREASWQKSYDELKKQLADRFQAMTTQTEADIVEVKKAMKREGRKGAWKGLARAALTAVTGVGVGALFTAGIGELQHASADDQTSTSGKPNDGSTPDNNKQPDGGGTPDNSKLPGLGGTLDKDNQPPAVTPDNKDSQPLAVTPDNSKLPTEHRTDNIVTSAEHKGAPVGPSHQVKIEQLFHEGATISPDNFDLVITHHGEGYEHSLIRQFEAQADDWKDDPTYGRHEGEEVHDWAGRVAHVLALEKGIVYKSDQGQPWADHPLGGQMQETRINSADQVGIVLSKGADGAPVLKEIDLKINDDGYYHIKEVRPAGEATEAGEYTVPVGTRETHQVATAGTAIGVGEGENKVEDTTVTMPGGYEQGPPPLDLPPVEELKPATEIPEVALPAIDLETIKSDVYPHSPLEDMLVERHLAQLLEAKAEIEAEEGRVREPIAGWQIDQVDLMGDGILEIIYTKYDAEHHLYYLDINHDGQPDATADFIDSDNNKVVDQAKIKSLFFPGNEGEALQEVPISKVDEIASKLNLNEQTYAQIGNIRYFAASPESRLLDFGFNSQVYLSPDAKVVQAFTLNDHPGIYIQGPEHGVMIFDNNGQPAAFYFDQATNLEQAQNKLWSEQVPDGDLDLKLEAIKGMAPMEDSLRTAGLLAEQPGAEVPTGHETEPAVAPDSDAESVSE